LEAGRLTNEGDDPDRGESVTNRQFDLSPRLLGVPAKALEPTANPVLGAADLAWRDTVAFRDGCSVVLAREVVEGRRAPSIRLPHPRREFLDPSRDLGGDDAFDDGILFRATDSQRSHLHGRHTSWDAAARRHGARVDIEPIVQASRRVRPLPPQYKRNRRREPATEPWVPDPRIRDGAKGFGRGGNGLIFGHLASERPTAADRLAALKRCEYRRDPRLV